jgi:putative transcriptional regulator
MKSLARAVRAFACLAALSAAWLGTAHAADLSHPVILVASDRLAGTSYEETVVLAAPLPRGGHVGFVVNRPTGMKLENLFPEQAAARNVNAPVYAGGPVLPSLLFAVTRKAPDEGGKAASLMPGLVVAIDAATVDHIIETRPNDARYFVGLMTWPAGDLEDEIGHGAWDVRPADVDTVLPDDPGELWESLGGTRA